MTRFDIPRRSIIWFGVILLVVGVVATAVGVFLGVVEGRFRTEGVIAEAVVVDRRIDRSDDDTDYVVDYTFTPPGGFEVLGSDEIDRDAWERLEPGAAIRVEYLPDDPGRNRPVGSGGWAEVIIVSIVGGIGVPVGGVLVAVGVRRVLRHRQLLREGIPVEATVIGPEATSYRVNRRYQWVVVYRYTDRLGGEHIGRSDHMPMHRAIAWQPGTTVRVRYDPLRPDESAWVG